MAGQRDRQLGNAKRTGYEREMDLLEMHSLRLRRFPPAEIIRRMNKIQYDRALAAAKESGLPEGEAAAVAQQAVVSGRTIRADFLRLRRKMTTGARAAAELMVRERIDELELERRATELAEYEAWKAWELSLQPEVRETQVREPVEHPILDAAGKPTGEVERVLRPLQVSTQRTNRAGDPRFIAQALACIELRMKLAREQFELSMMLSIEPPVDLSGLRSGDGKEATRELLIQQLEFFYRVEARAVGRNVDEQRLKLITSLAASSAPPPPAGGGGPKNGAAEPLIVELIGLPLPPEEPA